MKRNTLTKINYSKLSKERNLLAVSNFFLNLFYTIRNFHRRNNTPLITSKRLQVTYSNNFKLIENSEHLPFFNILFTLKCTECKNSARGILELFTFVDKGLYHLNINSEKQFFL